tara:strand:+ start:7307 stop:8254 length:948 start_codon:yes stop_codon:yes gene_type:complete
MKKKIFDEFQTAIADSKRVLITAHRYPDTDAAGSCIALAEELKKQDKEVIIWLADGVHENFKFLPLVDTITRKFPTDFKFNVLVVLDCSDLNRVGKYELIEDATHSFTTVNMDHHSDNTGFGDINIVENISSVGELLFSCFKALNWEFNKDIATCLYSAISFDTGRFAYSSVTSETMKSAASLIESGAEPAPITRALDENRNLDDLELIKIAIDNLVTNDEKKYAYSILPKNAPRGKIKLIDFIRKLQDYEVFIIFQELKPYVTKVNLRSKTYFNVAEFASQFGGGGHIHAAGILIDNSVNDIKEDLLEKLDKVL